MNDFTKGYMRGYKDAQKEALSSADGEAQPAVAIEQEPVAWAEFDGEGGYHFLAYEDNEDYAEQWDKRNPNHVGWVKPLYATSLQPQQEQGPIGFYSGRLNGHDLLSLVIQIPVGTNLYTTPPQRTAAVGEDTRRAWVGLTDEETAELVHRYAFYELTRQIEAKLKEKNT